MEGKSELIGEMTLELVAYLLYYSVGVDDALPWKSDGHSIRKWRAKGGGKEKIRDSSFHCER